MNFLFYSTLTIPIQKPESIVRFDTVCLPAALPPAYQVKYAFWDVLNEELEAMFHSHVDDFGNDITHHIRLDLPCYFAVQRADDPGIFHYREEPNAGNLQS